MTTDPTTTAAVKAGPHEFRPLRWWDRRAQGRCYHCHLAAELHPVKGWVPARTCGDKSHPRSRLARTSGGGWSW